MRPALFVAAGVLGGVISALASVELGPIAVVAGAALVAVVAATRDRPAATALLLPLCLLPYALNAGGLLVSLSDGLLLVVGAVLLVDWAVGRQPGPLLGPLAVPAVGFVVWTAASAAWAADPGRVLVETSQRAALVLLGVAVVHAMPADGRAVRRAVVGLVAGSAALGAATTITGAIQGRWFAVYALGMHKNWIGFVLSFGLVAVVAMALTDHRRPRGLMAAAAVSIASGLVLSGSRGAWVGTLAALALLAALNRPSLAWPAGSVAAVAVALVLVAVPGNVFSGVHEPDPDTSAGTRVLTWSSGLATIRRQPALGVGAGNFLAVVKGRGSQGDPNNLLLLTWAETGVFGVVLLGGIVVGTLRLATRNSGRWAAGGQAHLASLAGAGIFVAALAHAQFDIFWTRGVALATFMGAGLVLWAHRHGDATSSPRPPRLTMTSAP
ncbi:MAG TPA: O-antigen ligase family protein [Acidimicrobiales bacterium]|nr:O-antigen ligase family protein [Acidimicrobiales bacterium]